MRKFITAALAFTMLATSSVTLAGTSEARHRGHYYNNDYYHHRDRGRHNDAAAAAIFGLALGAIVIGSQNNRRDNYYRDDYRSRDTGWDHVRRCEANYRSYDRRTDTFIGRDGREYYCNL